MAHKTFPTYALAPQGKLLKCFVHEVISIFRIHSRYPQYSIELTFSIETNTNHLVGRNGVEPFTSFLSGTRSTAEPTTQIFS